MFRASDKDFYINCGNDKIFHRLVARVLERADLAADTELADRNGRIRRRDELFGTLDEAFAQQPWAVWQARMRAASIPCGEVRTVGEAIRSPEARDRKIVTRIKHKSLGWLPNVSLPIRYSRTPLADPLPAPLVGEHTIEVLRETLGYDAEKIDAFKRSGVIGEPSPSRPLPARLDEAVAGTS